MTQTTIYDKLCHCQLENFSFTEMVDVYPIENIKKTAGNDP